MRNSFICPLVVGLILLSNYSKSQVTYAKPEEFKILKSRTLIVQLLDERPGDFASMESRIANEKDPEKKEALTKQLKDARNYVPEFNKNLREAVTNLWDLNAKIEFKTSSEVAALRKAKSKAYTVLFYSQSSSQQRDDYNFKLFPGLSIPTLNYSRIETGTVKIDYSYFMYYTHFRNENVPRYAEFALSLKMMKNHISKIEKLNKKKYSFKEFAEDEAKANCSQAKGKEVKIDVKSIHKNSTEDELKKDYSLGTLSFHSAEDIDKIIEAEADEIISIAVPSTIVISKMGLITTATITYYRIFVNAKTGEIYSISGVSFGDFNDIYFRPKSIRIHSNCK